VNCKANKLFAGVNILNGSFSILYALCDLFVCAEYLTRKEVKIQARENKIRERRDARLAIEKAEHEKRGFIFDACYDTVIHVLLWPF